MESIKQQRKKEKKFRFKFGSGESNWGKIDRNTASDSGGNLITVKLS